MYKGLEKNNRLCDFLWWTFSNVIPLSYYSCLCHIKKSEIGVALAWILSKPVSNFVSMVA